MLAVEQEATKRHIQRLALDHWTFNQDAHAFFDRWVTRSSISECGRYWARSDLSRTTDMRGVVEPFHPP